MRISDWSSDVCSSDLAQTRRQRHAGAGREVAGAELAILLAREHQVEHHVPIRARKLGAAEMILTDAARLQAEADLFDQHRLRITLGAPGPLLGTDGEHFLDLADPRLDLGDIPARIFFHPTTR